jgi:ATP-dependent Lon protease
MARPQPDSSGYSALLLVDAKTGRYVGSETILVPIPLAEAINEARRVLYLEGDRADAWTRACVTRVVPPPPHDQEGGEDGDAGVAKPRVLPVADAAPATRRRRVAKGHRVQVISAAAITERRDAIEFKIKYSSEEKRSEKKVMEDLLVRGETRLIGLRKDWRSRVARLRAEMPHLSKVTDRIEACCALSDFARQPLRIPPLLLVGPPGVGKTHFARSVADILGVPQFVYALESAETVSVLCGSDKHWSNSEAGQLFNLIVHGERANPVVVLDELDKVTDGSQYKPGNALLTVLEPSTAAQLRDKCIDLTFDASYVVYIATANRLSAIDTALVSRFELFFVDSPEPRAAVAIARAVGQRVLQELKLGSRFDAPTGEVVQQLALLGSPRRMHKVLSAAIGRAVVGGRPSLSVEDLLESPEVRSPMSERDAPVH